MNRYGTNN